MKRKEISSLQQKFEITNRALEQESMEKEQKEKRIMQLEKSHKVNKSNFIFNSQNVVIISESTCVLIINVVIN